MRAANTLSKSANASPVAFVGRSRARMVTLAPAATVRASMNAPLVPSCMAGSEASVPCTTKSLKVSFGCRPAGFGVPKQRCVFVSFSQNSVRSKVSQLSCIVPSAGWSARMMSRADMRRLGLGVPGFHDQVLRNQVCSSSVIGAASGPLFFTVTRQRMSSGSAFAHSTVTSK